jgi:trehalose 6-phosphate phosphatase
VVRDLAATMAAGPGLVAAAAFGDDLGDLPAFAALGELAASDPELAVVRVAVVDVESPPEVAAAADLSVEGVPGAVALLEVLAG